MLALISWTNVPNKKIPLLEVVLVVDQVKYQLYKIISSTNVLSQTHEPRNCLNVLGTIVWHKIPHLNEIIYWIYTIVW